MVSGRQQARNEGQNAATSLLIHTRSFLPDAFLTSVGVHQEEAMLSHSVPASAAHAAPSAAVGRDAQRRNVRVNFGKNRREGNDLSVPSPIVFRERIYVSDSSVIFSVLFALYNDIFSSFVYFIYFFFIL